MPDGPHPQGGAAVGADLASGSFNYQFQYTISDLQLHELEGRWGKLDILSDPAFQLQFPTSPGPAQAGLMVNYLHYQLPRLGPFIVSLAVQGATNYLHTRGWQLAHSLNGDIRLAREQWLVLSGSGGFNVNFFGAGSGARVEPAGQITLGVEIALERRQVVRPTAAHPPAAGGGALPSLGHEPIDPGREAAQDIDMGHLADAHHRLMDPLFRLQTDEQLDHNLVSIVLELITAANGVVHDPEGTGHAQWNQQLTNAYHAWEHLNVSAVPHDRLNHVRQELVYQFQDLDRCVGGWRGQHTGPHARATEGDHHLTIIGEAVVQAAHELGH